MLDRAISESGAERAGLGLADTIVRQLSPLVYRAGQGG
jgi:Rod binding domain-containing protein